MNRGDIYWAELAPRSGAEQQGRRPVLILSHDAFNRTAGWKSVIVVPLTTSARQAVRAPTTVTIPVNAGGLAKLSVAVCHQITTLDRSKLKQKIGTLPASFMTAIEEAIKAALDMD